MVYLLVVDISKSLADQKEQVQHWLRYLKSQLEKLDNVPILLIGNKDDLISAQQREDTIAYFNSLKKTYPLDYVILSARKVVNVKSFLKMLKSKCLSLLDSNYFVIPRLYKQVAEEINQVRLQGKFLLGNLLNCC